MQVLLSEIRVSKKYLIVVLSRDAQAKIPHKGGGLVNIIHAIIQPGVRLFLVGLPCKFGHFNHEATIGSEYRQGASLPIGLVARPPGSALCSLTLA